MAALEQETTNLSHTLLRISGAIQVLEELTDDEDSQNDDDMTTSVEEIPQNDKAS